MQLTEVHLQYDRLVRHRDSALANRDPISFLDLAHVLRIWTEMKEVITEMAAKRNLNLEFGKRPKETTHRDVVRGSNYIYMPLASGVASPGIEVRGFLCTDRLLGAEDATRLAKAGPPKSAASRLTFSQWMGADVYEVSSQNEHHPQLSISRAMLIKRTANLLGASHPAGMEDDDTHENRFDPYIHELHQINLAGYPATYYQLLEIAGDIIEGVKPLRTASV